MRKEQELIITIRQTVTTMGDKHCSNECVHLGIHLSPHPNGNIWVGNCALFELPLSWDKACRYHGYIRCGECTTQARVKSLSSKLPGPEQSGL